jgi:hypothetical protein
MRWIVCLIISVCSTTSHAWNDTGHRLVALIAYERLTPERRAELVKLLEKHPRFAEDFEKRMPRGLSEEDRAKWVFAQAAVWPDIARDYRNVDGRLYARFHRGPWHYVNKPVYLDDEARKALLGKLPEIREEPVEGRAGEQGAERATARDRMNILQALHWNVTLLRDGKRDETERAVALCWVMHLVGDLHQPLHASGLYSAGRFADLDGDRGGNEIGVAGVEGARNLHAVWDDLMGDSFHLPTLVKEAGEVGKWGNGERVNVTEYRAWMEESYAVAREAAYAEEVLKVVREGEKRSDQQLRAVVLSAQYMKKAKGIARERVGAAGARLGGALDEAKAHVPADRN